MAFNVSIYSQAYILIVDLTIFLKISAMYADWTTLYIK